MELFPETLTTPDERLLIRANRQPAFAIWTHRKAQQIYEYLYRFIQVTKHGTYIDGFAGPQRPGQTQSWSAEEVLKLDLLTAFHLHELMPQQLDRLHALKDASDRRDQIEIHDGDFNATIGEVLRPEVIPMTEATFCLLDQRTAECHWSTVRQIADYKADTKYKIELFYFFANGWLSRVLASKTPESLAAWWGRDDWMDLSSKQAHERGQILADRFEGELGYAHAKPWPILDADYGGRIAYHMVHATDHPRGLRLMEDAYRAAGMEPPREEQRLFNDGI